MCVCFRPICSGRQSTHFCMRWAHQLGSHRRKVNTVITHFEVDVSTLAGIVSAAGSILVFEKFALACLHVTPLSCADVGLRRTRVLGPGRTSFYVLAQVACCKVARGIHRLPWKQPCVGRSAFFRCGRCIVKSRCCFAKRSGLVCLVVS